MKKCIPICTAIALTVSLMVLRPAAGEDLLIGGFEGDLLSPFPNSWEVQNGTSTFVETGATEGAMAIEHVALEDGPDNPETPENDPYEGNGWHFRLYLDGGSNLASAMATYDTLSVDITVPQIDGWRQLVVVMQGDGGSGYFANWSNSFVAPLQTGLNNVTFDLSDPAAGNIKAAAQPGEGAPQWAQLFVVVQGDYDSAPFTHQIDNIRFSKTVAELPGDFDGNNIVDNADLALWTAGFGQIDQTNDSNGDADADGDVDGADFLIWQQNVIPTVAVSSVPEPAAAALALVGLCALASRRRVLA
jgi:MYXO-CTERM domain-containing protein